MTRDCLPISLPSKIDCELRSQVWPVSPAKSPLGIVVTCYNEEPVIRDIAKRLLVLMRRLVAAGKIAANSRMYLVDDGSRDRTWEIMAALAAPEPTIKGIK